MKKNHVRLCWHQHRRRFVLRLTSCVQSLCEMIPVSSCAAGHDGNSAVSRDTPELLMYVTWPLQRQTESVRVTHNALSVWFTHLYQVWIHTCQNGDGETENIFEFLQEDLSSRVCVSVMWLVELNPDISSFWLLWCLSVSVNLMHPESISLTSHLTHVSQTSCLVSLQQRCETRAVTSQASHDLCRRSRTSPCTNKFNTNPPLTPVNLRSFIWCADSSTCWKKKVFSEFPLRIKS